MLVLQASCIEYVILESDNLSTLFPRAHISFGGLEINAHLLFAIATALAVLPTVYLRDLSILSYISGKLARFILPLYMYMLMSFIDWSCISCSSRSITSCQGHIYIRLYQLWWQIHNFQMFVYHANVQKYVYEFYWLVLYQLQWRSHNFMLGAHRYIT